MHGYLLVYCVYKQTVHCFELMNTFTFIWYYELPYRLISHISGCAAKRIWNLHVLKLGVSTWESQRICQRNVYKCMDSFSAGETCNHGSGASESPQSLTSYYYPDPVHFVLHFFPWTLQDSRLVLCQNQSSSFSKVFFLCENRFLFFLPHSQVTWEFLWMWGFQLTLLLWGGVCVLLCSYHLSSTLQPPQLPRLPNQKRSNEKS